MAVPGRNDSWIASSSSNSSRPTARKRVWIALLFLAAFSINAGHAAGAGKVAAASDAMPVTGRDHSCAPVRVGPGDTDSDTVVAKCWGSGGRTSGKMRYSGQLGTGTPESHGASADSMGERLPPVFLERQSTTTLLSECQQGFGDHASSSALAVVVVVVVVVVVDKLLVCAAIRPVVSATVRASLLRRFLLPALFVQSLLSLSAFN